MTCFCLDFLNLISCKHCNGVMLENLVFLIFPPFFKNRVKCPFKTLSLFAFSKKKKKN